MGVYRNRIPGAPPLVEEQGRPPPEATNTAANSRGAHLEARRAEARVPQIRGQDSSAGTNQTTAQK